MQKVITFILDYIFINKVSKELSIDAKILVLRDKILKIYTGKEERCGMVTLPQINFHNNYSKKMQNLQKFGNVMISWYDGTSFKHIQTSGPY